MADGRMIVNPAEARDKATRMKTIADELETLLNNVSREIEKIDNVDTGVYQGNRKPAELRAELDQFRSMFKLTYGQVIKSANDIIAIANTMEAE